MTLELLAWMLAAVGRVSMLAREVAGAAPADAAHGRASRARATSCAARWRRWASRWRGSRTPARPGAWRDTVEALRAQQARALLATEDLEAARGPAARASARGELPRGRRGAGAPLRALLGRGRTGAGAWCSTGAPGRPAVLGQAGRLGQALDNLIANALEHGAGRVTVVGRVSRGSVTVSVLDLGGGLRALAERAPAGSWRSRRGHGLAIVRRAVEDHGGRMRLVRESSGTGVQI